MHSNIPGAYTKSGGPKTLAGKTAASLNALRSGAYSSLMLLPNESKQDYQAFADALLADLQPETHLMQTLAMSVIDIVWRMKRLQYFESSVFQAGYNKPIDERELINALGATYPDVMAAARRITDNALKNGVDYYLKQLEDLVQLERANPGAWPQLSTLKSQHPFIYACFQQLSGKENAFDQAVSQSIAKGLGASYWLELVKKVKDSLARQINDFSMYAKYERAVQQIRDQRIFRLLVEDAAARPRNDLSRALQRAMAEYHRERDRYRKESVVLLDKEPPADSAEVNERGEVEDVQATSTS